MQVSLAAFTPTCDIFGLERILWRGLKWTEHFFQFQIQIWRPQAPKWYHQEGNFWETMKSWDELSRWMELLPDKRDVNSYSFSRMWGPRRQPRSEPSYADIVILAFSIQNCRKLDFYYLNLYSRNFFTVFQSDEDKICSLYVILRLKLWLWENLWNEYMSSIWFGILETSRDI